MGDPKWVWVKLLLLFVLLENCWSEGCWEQERVALLQLKHYSFYDSSRLQNWVEGDENSDCCKWEGVECNNNTGRVTQLYLSSASNHWQYMNVSLFSPFQELEWLDLSFNGIAGCIENKGQMRLNNLKFLNLSRNLLENNIYLCINGLSSLITLHLYENRLNGTINVKEIESLSNLKELDISFNDINNFVALKGQMRLNNLKFLDLSYNQLENSIFSCINGLSSLTKLSLYKNILNGTINVKEIEYLSNLEELDIGGNNINKFLTPKGYRSLSKLHSLSLGNFDFTNINKINGSGMLESLWKSFPYLKTLELRGYDLCEKTTDQELLIFTNLEDLSLHDSSVHISFLQSIAAVSSVKLLSISGGRLHGTSLLSDFPKFRSLETLVMLSSELIDISFLQISKSLASLEILYLYDCLQGTIVDQGLCELVNLEELYIGANHIKGTLPSCLANMTSLRVLDISSNQITGNISLSPLRYLTSIEELIVSHNQLQIPISLEPFFNHSKLKKFYAKKNQLYAEPKSHVLRPKFQLNLISLSGCRYNGTFPKFLHYQSELRDVDLSYINLRGEFPNWLLENNTKLNTLLLANNSLSGLFRTPVNPLKQLTIVDASNNFIQGHIPAEIGAFLPRLKYLNISTNAFNGSIPSSFGDINSLKSLDISNNQLTGEIPERMAMGCFSLQILALSNNNLQGQIFSRSFNLTNLLALQLDDNQFTGGIPESLSNCSLLQGLFLSDNQISGKIPKWLGNLSYLVDFVMPNNHIQGPIPTSLCKLNYLTVLDLEVNDISGSLPSCFSPPSIRQVHLSRNKIEGKLEDAFTYSYSMETLDLSYNHFSGRIPNWIDALFDLSYLILANNYIEGEVPVRLCLLNQLRLIDLSHNNLSGKIPSCLYKTALSDGNYDAAAPVEGNYNAAAPIEGNYNAAGPIKAYDAPSPTSTMRKEETVQFTTKKMSYYYQGRILTNMYGLDLSCNKLTGEIPLQIGYLNNIRALNLSHNNLTGTIPTTFSSLHQIESLDLSYNLLQGKIPPQLLVLYALAIFSVAHNNLSGKTLDRVAQFGTFTEDSYEGNPLLCGLPLPKSCNENESPRQQIPKATNGNEEDYKLIDMDSFYITFTVSYVIVIFGIIGVLYVNSYWRRRWFYLVEIWITSCYYFCVDHLIPTRFCRGNK